MPFRHEDAQAAQGSGPPSGVIIERPPPGLARGRYPASPLFIGAFGTLLVLATLLYFYLRLRKPHP